MPIRLRNIAVLSEKGVGEINEDAVLVSGRRFGVFDGATSKDKFVNNDGFTGGYLASHLAADAIGSMAAPLAVSAHIANDVIRDAMRVNGIDLSRKEHLWGTAVAAIELDLVAEEFDWVQISDSLILVINRDASYRVLPADFVDQDFDYFIKFQQLLAQGHPEPSKALWEESIGHRCDANVTYGVLNGEPDAMKFLMSGTEPLADVAHIILFTDGLFIPQADRSQPHDFGAIVKCHCEGGLMGVRDLVRDLEVNDPLCRAYPRSKKHDDMTAIALAFE